MVELKMKVEKLGEKIDEVTDKFNLLMDTISKILEEQKAKNVCECAKDEKQANQDMIIHQTYEIVKRMNFENEKRIWEERAKECEDKIKELQDKKRHIDYECKEVEDRYYRGF